MLENSTASSWAIEHAYLLNSDSKFSIEHTFRSTRYFKERFSVLLEFSNMKSSFEYNWVEFLKHARSKSQVCANKPYTTTISSTSSRAKRARAIHRSSRVEPSMRPRAQALIQAARAWLRSSSCLVTVAHWQIFFPLSSIFRLYFKARFRIY